MAESETTLTAREDTYRLLAACYYSPTRALIEEDCCGSLAKLLANLAPEAAQYAQNAAALIKESTVEAQLVEHTRLFMGPFKLVAAPYGSVWLDEHKHVMGDSTAKVAAFYHACGLCLADDFHELPDHFAVELEFLSFLAFKQREAEAAENNESTQRYVAMQLEFLDIFLLPWLTPFTDAVINDGEAPFYVEIARCTAAFIKTDAESLKSVAKI